jgi:hypothetical protein
MTAALWIGGIFLGSFALMLGLVLWAARRADDGYADLDAAFDTVLNGRPCVSGHTDCTVDCGWCKGTGRMVSR